MKRLLLLIFLLLPIYASAASWWVNFTTGNDVNPGTLANPFKTLTKLATVYHPGDNVSFNGGDVFNGTFSPSGGVVQNYGTGRAIISGFDDLSGWVNISGNLWRAHDGNLGATVKVLTINGVQKPMGRFPHATYTNYNNVVGNTSIMAAGLIGTWTGHPQIVIRKSHFEEQTYPITGSISGTGVVTYAGSGTTPLNNFGCFLQNSPEACTVPGDWCYDGAGNITLYSIGAPTGVKASRYEDLFTVAGNSTIIQGIDFIGANGRGIYSNNRTGVIIRDFSVKYSDIGLYLNNNANDIIDGVSGLTFDHINGNAIAAATSTVGITIRNIKGTNIGMVPGAATEYSAIRVFPISARNTVISDCDISIVGYNAYFIEGTVTANHLIGHDALQVLDDGGIFYTGVGHSPSVMTASTLSNSIFYGAIGAPQGTSNGINQACAVYLDDYSNHWTISNVVGYNAGEYVFFSHNNQDVTWSNCTGYNGIQAVWAGIHDNLGGKLSNILLSNNKFINLTPQINFLRSITTDGLATDVTTWGTAANNKYGNTSTVTSPFQTQIYTPTPQSAVNRNFASWQSITAQDGTSTYVTVPSPSQWYPNPSASILPITLTAVYKDLAGTSYGPGTVNIPAYSALYLYYFSGPPVTPPAISYSPNNYTVYVNAPITTFSPVNSGGTIIAATISAAQPTGIAFNTTTGTFSGTPIVLSASQTYTVMANNAGGSSSTPITIAVIDHPPVVTYSGSPQSAVINVPITPFNPTLTSGGPVVSYSVFPALPTGVSLNTTTGVISGTPTVLSATTTYTVSATNTGGTYTVTVQLSVNNPAVVAPNVSYSPSTYILPISVPISTISPISTGGPVDSYSISPSLPATLSFSTSVGTISGTPTALTSPTVYTITAHNVTADFPTTVTLSVISVAPPAPVPAYTPSTRTFQIGLSVGAITPTNSAGYSNTWAVTPGLPTGLSFNATTGVITGTPTVLSPLTTYDVSAVNAGGTGHVFIQIRVVTRPAGGRRIPVHGMEGRIKH